MYYSKQIHVKRIPSVVSPLSTDGFGVWIIEKRSCVDLIVLFPVRAPEIRLLCVMAVLPLFRACASDEDVKFPGGEKVGLLADFAKPISASKSEN